MWAYYAPLWAAGGGYGLVAGFAPLTGAQRAFFVAAMVASLLEIIVHAAVASARPAQWLAVANTLVAGAALAIAPGKVVAVVVAAAALRAAASLAEQGQPRDVVYQRVPSVLENIDDENTGGAYMGETCL